MEINGGSPVSYLARSPCVPLFYAWFDRSGNGRALRPSGEGRHCTVDPSLGHIQCRVVQSNLGLVRVSPDRRVNMKRVSFIKGRCSCLSP